jgi:hypothetical protein
MFASIVKVSNPHNSDRDWKLGSSHVPSSIADNLDADIVKDSIMVGAQDTLEYLLEP